MALFTPNNVAAQLSAFNGFVPRATGQVISYIRNPDEFPVNNYVQYLESDQTQGYYFVIDRDTPSRVVTDEEYAWEDGDERPVTPYNGLSFAIQNFVTQRRNVSTVLGDQAVAMADDAWAALEHHVGSIAQTIVTLRTKRVVNLLTTASNWNGINVADANQLNNGAGTWDKASDDPSSPYFNAIKKTLLAAKRQIVISTRGFVQRKDLMLMISPDLAQIMANTAEIHAYLKSSPFSMGVIEGKEPNIVDDWGLPPTLYGFKLIIEDTTIVNDRPTATGGVGSGASTNANFLMPTTSAVIMSRKGGIDGQYGSPSFSTVQVYWYEYLMSIFAWHEPRNARTLVDASEQYAEILAAPESGFLVTNCVPS